MAAELPALVGIVKLRSWLDGRILLVAAAFALGARMAALSMSHRVFDWALLGVPALNRTFGDLRVVTSAWDCSRLGYDVLVGNPCDPWGRAMNYPRLWLLPGWFGLGQSATNAIGIVLCATFLAAVLALVGRLDLPKTGVYGAALASPAVLLGIERGNIDLAIFALCVVGVLAIQRAGSMSTAVGVLVLLLATMLKLYPVFALIILVPRARLAIGALVIALLYALLIRSDLALISTGTPRSLVYAYGIEPLGATFRLNPVVAGLLLIGVVLLFSTRSLARGAAEDAVPSLARDAFVMGSAIFVGTSLIGSNWAYRLMFLLLTIPQLLDWVRIARTRSLAIGIGVMVMAALWLVRYSEVRGLGMVGLSAVTAALFVALGGLTTAMVWQDLKPDVDRVYSRLRVRSSSAAP